MNETKIIQKQSFYVIVPYGLALHLEVSCEGRITKKENSQDVYFNSFQKSFRVLRI